MYIAVPMLVLWYCFHAVLSRFAGTCTMGDTDRFVAGAILGVPAATIAVVLLLVVPVRARWQIGSVLASAALALVVLCVWVPVALSAGIRGHHLCGPEFDRILDAAGQWERVIPLAHVAVGAALLVSGFRSVSRAWAAQPAVAADGALHG